MSINLCATGGHGQQFQASLPCMIQENKDWNNIIKQVIFQASGFAVTN
jgi:hypothetical protein